MLMTLRTASNQYYRTAGAALIVFACTGLTAGAAYAYTSHNSRCTNTATAGLRACKRDASVNYWLVRGMCENRAAAVDREACIRDAAAARRSDSGDCVAQLAVRQALCTDLGENAYEPEIVPANFTTVIDNPFMPLVPGVTFVYNNTNGEVVTVGVTDDTQEVLGVTTVVVHDTVTVGGDVIEDTFDYYAEDALGNVWYFGEDTAAYANGVVIGVAGAWRAGVGGAKPGIVMEGSPTVGDIYRQEFLLGAAEDHARVAATNANATAPWGGTYTGCVETAESSGLEPDANESKFFASGVGLVLVIDNVTGEREELVNVTGP